MQPITSIILCSALALAMGGTASAEQLPSKSVRFSKIILNPDIPKTSQHIKVGTICLFAGTPLNFGTEEHTLGFERFERLFTKLVKGRGFNVVAKSSNLFDSEADDASVDYLIGATLRPTEVNMCDSVSGQKGSIAVSVEWQIFERSSRHVVETITTAGVGKLEKFQQNGLGAMFDDAYSASLTALVEQGVLKKYLGEPQAASPKPGAS